MEPLAGAGDDVGNGQAVYLEGGAGHEGASLAVSGGAAAAVIWMELVSMEMQVWLSVDVTWMELVSMEMQVWLSVMVLLQLSSGWS